MSQYRDPLAGLRSQVATKRAALESRDRAFSAIARAMLPARLRKEMTDLRPRVTVTEETMAALSSADAALDGLLVAYDEADALTPRLRELPDTVRQPPPCRMPPPWLIEEPDVLALRHALTRRLAEITVDARIARWGDIAYIARFDVSGAPFVYVVKSDVMPSDGPVERFEAELRTSVPEALPSLVVKPQRSHHSVRKALHLAHEIEVGVPAFDAAFWITGSADSAALLTPDVRAALLGHEHLLEELSIGDEVASITWQGRPWNPNVDPIPQFAVDVLLALRRAATSG